MSLHAEKISLKEDDVPSSCAHVCHYASSVNVTTDKLMDEKKSMKSFERCDSDDSVGYSDNSDTEINEHASRTVIISIACGGLFILSAAFLCVLRFLRRNGQDRTGSTNSTEQIKGEGAL